MYALTDLLVYGSFGLIVNTVGSLFFGILFSAVVLGGVFVLRRLFLGLASLQTYVRRFSSRTLISMAALCLWSHCINSFAI